MRIVRIHKIGSQEMVGNLGLTDEKRQIRGNGQKKLRKSWINWREKASGVRSFMWRPSCQTAPVWDSHTPILLCRLIIIIIISGLYARIWFCCSNIIWAFFSPNRSFQAHWIFFVGLLFFLRAFWVVTSLLGDNFGQQQTMWPLVHRNQLKIIKMMTSHWKPMKGPWKDLEKSWKLWPGLENPEKTLRNHESKENILKKHEKTLKKLEPPWKKKNLKTMQTMKIP